MVHHTLTSVSVVISCTAAVSQIIYLLETTHYGQHWVAMY